MCKIRVFCFWLLLVWFREMRPHYVALADLELYVDQARASKLNFPASTSPGIKGACHKLGRGTS